MPAPTLAGNGCHGTALPMNEHIIYTCPVQSLNPNLRLQPCRWMGSCTCHCSLPTRMLAGGGGDPVTSPVNGSTRCLMLRLR